MRTNKIATIAKAIKVAAVAVLAVTVVLGLAGPATATSGAVYGDPAAAAKYWRYQQYWDDCVLISSADVVGEVTGVEPSEEEIIDMAQSTPSSQGPGPIYTRPADPKNPNSGEGAWFRDIPTLLGRYNVGADIINGDIEGIEQALAAGHKVVVSVNGEIVWRKPVEDWDKHGNPAHNHSLVVTGVDTGNETVHLNDSGSRQGRDEQIPLALFMQAWGASNDLMVVTA
ncbi:C39 family peptidase [Mycobacterium sp.]|uniref:C39 family peptidase n=1 Tax=Mycobacterium sp. TaxID=1785 RepID=UPI003C74E6C7